MQIPTQDTRAWALLLRAPGLSSMLMHTALREQPDVAQLLAQPTLLTELGFPERTRRFLETGSACAAVDADLAWLHEAPDRHLVPFSAPAYPPLLRQAPGAPVGLYVHGSLQVLQRPHLAIVGSRNPTPTGRELAFDFARHLARCGLVIVSGLAEGIDGAAHRGALAEGGATVAVFGTGLGNVYPPQHAQLASQIVASGALVSEFPPDTTVRRRNFPQRNRIISGLSLGTLVVEAARHSGSLITARFATEQGREVFAIPGSIHSPLSRGCHGLIRDGARLVETADDVLAELGMLLQSQRAVTGTSHVRVAPAGALQPAPADTPHLAAIGVPALDKEYEILLDALGFNPTGVDALVERSGLKPEAIASMLLILELRGEVEARPGGRYCRRPNQALK